MSGNDVHVQSPLVQIAEARPPRRDLVLPAEDTLFTSGTLGRYSAKLHAVLESREARTGEASNSEAAAD
jgi:NADH-quinone oxidoreductase subunit G